MATKKKVAEEIKEEVKAVETKAKKAATAVKKAPAKAKTAVKAEAAKVEKKVAEKKPATKKVSAAKKAPAAKKALNVVIQSKMGGSITPAEVAAKVPKDAVNAYVKVEENKIYWTSDKDAGSVDIW